MRSQIKRFDAFLGRRLGIFSFSPHPGCLLRLQIARAPHSVNLGGDLLPAGAPVLLLHLANEHLPPIPRAGPDPAWAIRAKRLFLSSLRDAARYVCTDPRLADLPAVGMITAIFPPDPKSGGARFIRRLGFTIAPYHCRLGRFGEFWENFYAYWLIWTYNPAGLRLRKMAAMRRSEAWMPMGDFLNRYTG